MNIAISNIAWAPEKTADVRAIMHRLGIKGVEVAPTMVWKEPLRVSTTELGRYRRDWAEEGIEIVALQALLYGRPELTIFETRSQREKCFEHLRGMVELAACLGAGALVFGSPKNRRVGTLDTAQARTIAVDFFRRIGEVAERHDTRFCIEPNPAEYDCDFVRTAAEGCALVRDVAVPGFQLHLDAAALTLNGEDYEMAVGRCAADTAHFHVSEPFLGVVGTGATDHEQLAKALRRAGCKHWISIEQRSVGAEDLAAVEQALTYVSRVYGGDHD